MLSNMTEEWFMLTMSLSSYILQIRKTNEDAGKIKPLTIYNSWLSSSGLTVDDPEIAIWLLQYIPDVFLIPIQSLEEAIKMQYAI